MLIEDNVQTFDVDIISPDKKLQITNIEYSQDVELNTPFIITYTCKNLTGSSLSCFGYLVDRNTGREFNDSYWVQEVPSEVGFTITNDVEGITADTDLSIVVGLV